MRKLLLVFALICLCYGVALAEPGSPWIPDVGVVLNGGWGAKGATSQGGVTAFVPAIDTNVQIQAAAGAIALSVDWLPWGGPLAGSKANWVVGPGAYVAFASGDDTTAFGLGARAVFGAESFIVPSWQLFANLVPAVGPNWSRSEVEVLWNVDVELGFRYRIVSAKGE